MTDYTHHYQHVSHKELYDAVVQAGDPGQVDGLASQWSTLKDTLDDLARDLDADLDKLAGTWSGDAAREFVDRLSLVVRFSGELAEGTAQVRQALTDMADALRVAQRDAESPEETDDHDKMISKAKDGAIFGVGGAIIGGLIGHQQDKAEQEKAHQRMVQVVSRLAESYEVSAYGRVVDAPVPDPRLPGGADGPSSTARSGPGSSTPSAAPTTGLAGRRGDASVDTPGSVSPGPTGGSGTPETGTGGVGAGGPGAGGAVPGGTATPLDPGAGTQLAGADPLLGGALVGGAAVGAAGLAGATPTTPATPGVGPGLTFGAPGSVPAGGVVGTGSLASSGRGAPAPSARPAAGAPGMENRAAAGTGRLAAGQAGGNAGGT
ncbi:WXG100 family type VII secretion target, partial [Micromonospora psammae]|uniref:WXG100 family type VII secretion target n=1 Tax=Micromonospora sp. CPCC 205556 TaxID=3122398 RepID=UPI002FEFFD35